MYETESERWVKIERRCAAKHHECIYCSDPIRPGQEYARLVTVEKDGTPDGSLRVVKFHADDPTCTSY